MNAPSNNKLAMYRAVLALLESSPAPLSGIPALAAKVTLLSGYIAEILQLANTQALPTSGSIADRDKLLADTAHAVQVIAGAVLSYADENQMGELAARVRVRASDFNGRKEKQLQLATQVHDAAADVVGELADYGVTAAALAALQTQIAGASAALSRPRGTMAARKAATQQMPAVFRKADALLENQIDPLLLPLRKTHPEFYAKYKAARIIIDRRGGHDEAEPEAGPTAPGAPASGG